MRYVHGTDEKRHDLVRIWAYRALFLFFLLFFLILASVFVLFVRELFFSPDPQGSPHAAGEYLVFVMLAVVLVIFFWAMRGCVWRNARYTLDEQGITMIELFGSKRYPWSAFQAVYLSKIQRGSNDPVTHDYIILMISKCGALSRGLYVDECRMYRNHFLIVRSTEERLREFEQYCTISEPPDIPAYKYFL